MPRVCATSHLKSAGTQSFMWPLRDEWYRYQMGGWIQLLLGQFTWKHLFISISKANMLSNRWRSDTVVSAVTSPPSPVYVCVFSGCSGSLLTFIALLPIGSIIIVHNALFADLLEISVNLMIKCWFSVCQASWCLWALCSLLMEQFVPPELYTLNYCPTSSKHPWCSLIPHHQEGWSTASQKWVRDYNVVKMCTTKSALFKKKIFLKCVLLSCAPRVNN